MSDDCPGPLARMLADHPTLYRSLLAEHRADDYGRCAGCRSATLAPRWPCGLAEAAAAARRLAEGDDHTT